MTSNLSRGILSIIADDGPNRVHVVQPKPSEVEVRESDVVVGTFAADQVEVVVFQYGAGSSTYDNQTAIRDKQLRLANSGPLSREELGRKGDLDALLVDDTLTLTGPSGAGFQMTGSWLSTREDVGGRVRNVFTADGPMALHTALGVIPFTAAPTTPLSISTLDDLAADFGAVERVDWRTDGLFNTSNPNGALSRLQDYFGIDLTTGTLDVGIRLGVDLAELDAPLNAALPYIYFATTDNYQARFGDLDAVVGPDNWLNVAFDPQDPFLYARANEFSVGASLKGYIPFTPTLPLNGVTEPISGHLYGWGLVSAGDVPVRFAGTTVIDLDANRDGKLLGNLSGDAASRLLTGRMSLGELATGARDDLRAGFNGQATVGYTGAGFDLNLDVTASAVYVPGRIGVHGQTTGNLFGGTVLGFLGMTGLVDVTADLDDKGNGGIVVTAAAGTVAQLAAANMWVNLDGNGVAVSTGVTVRNLGDFVVEGTATADGRYSLVGYADVRLAGFEFTDGTVTLSDTGVALAGTVRVPSVTQVDVAGAVTTDGQYVLRGTTALTLAGFAIAEAAFTLRNNGLTLGARVAMNGIGQADLEGTVTTAGQYRLTGTANLTVASFPLTGAALTLTNTSLTVAADLSVPNLGTVRIEGEVTAPNQVRLTGTTNITVGGFALANAVVTLTNTSLTVAARTTIPNVGQVDLAGTLTAAGQYRLTGTATINVAGFALGAAALTLTNTSLTVAAGVGIPGVGTVNLAGTVTAAGQFALAGTSNITVAGFAMAAAAFALDNTRLTVAAGLTVPGLATVNLAGTVTAAGQFTLAGTANITVAGFALAGAFTLNNTSLTAAARISIPGVVVDVAGTVTTQGQVNLRGTATVTVAGFPLTSAAFTLTNTSLTVAAGITLAGVGTINLAGSLTTQGQFDLRGTANVTVAGFPLNAAFTLTNTQLTAAAGITIAGVGTINLAGSVTSQGQFDLRGTANVTVASFPLNAAFTLNNTRLTAAAGITLPGVGTVNVAGSVTAQGQFDLRGTANVTVAGFPLSAAFTLTNTQLTAAAGVTLPGVGTINLAGAVTAQGQFSLRGTSRVTIAAIPIDASFTLTNTQLTVAAGVTIPGVGNLNFNGTVNVQGQFNLSAQANVTIAGFALTPTFNLTNTQLTVAVGMTIPNVGNLSFAGTVTAQGQFNLTARANVTIAGIALNPSFTLTNTQLTVAVGVNVPLVGNINLSGTVNSQGQFDLTAAAPNLTILFVTLTNAQVRLTNTSLTVAARASNLPLVGTVDFVGQVAGGAITFTVTLPRVTVLGFTLNNLLVSLTTTALTVSTRATGLPIVGDVDFRGSISANGFSLSATAGTVTVAGFVTLTNPSLTLNQTSLTISAASNLPVVGTVTFAGTITAAGSFTISATAARFTVLGFVTFETASVALSFPNPTVTVAARTTLLHIGQVDFRGSLSAGGRYTFAGSARLVVAGFTLGEANMRISNDGAPPGEGIQIGPFTTPPLPVVGPVTLSGSYASGGRFSFRAEVNPTPPIVIGGIPFNRFVVGLTNDSLTFGAGIGINFGGLAIAQAYFEGTVSTNGDFRFLARVDAIQVLGFSAAQAQLTLEKRGDQTDLTLAAQANFIVATVNINGFIRFASGQYELRGSANIGVAGFTLSSTTFLATNIGGLRVALQSRTNIINVGIVNFDGTLTRSGGSYLIDVRAQATFQVAGFQLADARLELNNTRLFISVSRNIPGLATANFAGTLTSGGNFDLQATANITPGGFNMASAQLRLTNNSLDITASFAFPGLVTVNFAGFWRSTGAFELRGNAQVGLGGFAAINGAFLINNSGASVSGRVNVIVAQVDFSGSIDRTGNYSLTGSASVGLGGYSAVTGAFTLNNGGASVRATVNVVIATVSFSGSISRTGVYSLTGSASVGLGGFTAVTGNFTMTNSGASVQASVNVVVATVSFSGTIDRSGQYSLTGSAAVGLGGYSAVTGAFTLTNSGASVRATLNVVVATVTFSGTINRNGTYSLTGSAAVGLGGFTAVTGNFTLTNSGASVQATVNVAVATVSFSGSIDRSGNYSLTGSASVGLGGYSAVTGAFTLNNGGASVRATINVVVATVTFSGTINRNGTYSLTGSASVGLGGYSAVTGNFTLTNSGVSVQATINVVVATVSFSGTITRGGSYSLTGSAAVSLGGFRAVTGSFTLTNGGVAVRATVDVFVASVTFNGSINRSGQYSFTASAQANFAGFRWNTTFTLSNTSGVGISTRMGFSVMGFTANFNGRVGTNGSFSFTASSRLTFGPISANLGLTLSNTGFRATIGAAVDVTANIGFSFWSLRVGFRGSFDAGFGINTNGTFNVSGRFEMRAYLGISLGVGIGFEVSNTRILVRTGDIGFSLWGVGFHPFPHLSFNY